MNTWNARSIVVVAALLGFLALIVVGLLIPGRIGVLVVQGDDDVLDRLNRRFLRVRERRTGAETVISSPAKGLPLGEYDVEIDPESGLTVEPATVTIEAGRKTMIRVTARSRETAPVPSP